ncbi:MAG: hypothetical protein UW18_C0012G0013 [Microgenomates group bacterium GW2011_GWF1_44_10]|nr:MAG: hypothetical protein UW18_C0012G0013 [Microgenomates group bacterium GW2011_GWF1_44_10]
MLEIVLKVICKESRHDWRGEEAEFVIDIESPDMIDAIDLNCVKRILVNKAISLHAEKEAQKELKGE